MQIRKLFKAEMAHATVGAYTTRCHHIHGHSYRFELFLRSDHPNAAQMVSDFKAVKEMGIHDFFDSFDHTTMIWENDLRAPILPQINPDRHILAPFNPTAEMMSKAFFGMAQAIFDSSPGLSGEKGVRVESVIVHETETGYAQFGWGDLASDGFPPIPYERWFFSAGIKKEWKNAEWFDRAMDRLKKSR